MNDIHHIDCPAYLDDTFITAELEKMVSLWSCNARKRLIRFNTVLDFGGNRLALIPLKAPLIVAGAYSRHGICAYDSNGRLVWQRKDLKKVQQIRWIPSQDNLVGAGFDEKPYSVMNALTGENIISLRGVRELYPSQGGLALQLTNSDVGLIKLSDWTATWKNPKRSFAVLDVAFSDRSVLIAWSGGPLQCVDYSGKPLWEYADDDNTNFLKIAWSRPSGNWIGIQWNYTKGGPKKLVVLDESGRVKSKGILGQVVECAFFAEATQLITSEGKVMSIPRMEVLWDFLE